MMQPFDSQHVGGRDRRRARHLGMPYCTFTTRRDERRPLILAPTK